MAKATSIPSSSFGFEYWLNKAVEWGQATTSESQQDVCLHLPKLQEFLKQIYGAIQHMNTTEALKFFPMIGQFLGRLCWNPFVLAHDESQQNLLECLWCLYSAEPENPVEQKANDWIWSSLQSMISVNQEVRSFLQSFHYPEEDYHLKLLKNVVSSLVKQLQDYQSDRSSTLRLPPERWRNFSILCLPVLTLPEVVPLVEALLTCDDGLDETLSTEFLESVSNSLLQKKIFLSESAVMNLWLRYLPSLEQAILHLTESLISHPCGSLVEVEAIITDSLLPKASAYHPSLFRVIDNFFRTILLETDGHPKIITIIQAFTRCFVQVLLQVQTQMPLKLYFPHNQQSLVVALLTSPSDIPSAAWCQHLTTIVPMLKRIVQDVKVKGTTTNLFENWFLLVHFGDWLNVALQQLMTADELSEVLLWLLMFYNKPLMEDQQEKQLLEQVKFVYNQLKVLSNTAPLNAEDLQTALVTNVVPIKEGHQKDLINQLLVSFLLFTEGGKGIAKESVQLFTLGGDCLDGVSQLLVSTAHRLQNTKYRGSEDRMVQITVELLQHQLLKAKVTVQ
ncbi:Fanconi anemia group C protein [Pristis pectinata]|uniref:Fanconi anemia group C protein n=1 Tax=Pristis pectinata TaxID=685728 RepID=UPI00223DB54A|nr:Fanconi anemia group C protein [Pristis pectinata]XP_051876001.1 Fanconi anemia group C protein [Pristis pectinata]XP_051876002.1 Fanconi anemia group C protein [Pristis pectinata]